MNLKSLYLLCTMCFAFIQFAIAQEHNFHYLKGDDNISTIAVGNMSCAVVEYPDFLVVIDIPVGIRSWKMVEESHDKSNALITYIDSIYKNKPIKYVLNSCAQPIALSSFIPFLEKGAKLVTAKENLEIYDQRGLFGKKTSKDYSESIIQITSDTLLLANTENPIEVYLERAGYSKNLYLLFLFRKQNLLAASDLLRLIHYNKNHDFNKTIYTVGIADTYKIIKDKKLNVEKTLQLIDFKTRDNKKASPIFPISHLNKVIEQGLFEDDLSDYLNDLSYEELDTKKDSLLNFLIESRTFSHVLRTSLRQLTNNQEYKKALGIAQLHLAFVAAPRAVNSVGQAYYLNDQLLMAQHYDRIIKRLEPDNNEFGLEVWEKKAELEKWKSSLVQMTNKELMAEEDSITKFVIENNKHNVLNNSIYTLIDKKEYQRAVTLAKILIELNPDDVEYMDTLGEAYYNNGQMDMAKKYAENIKKAEPKAEGLGLKMWKINQKDRLKNDS